MAWSFVKQPNGQLARFSEVVDNFTHLNLTVEEAFHICTLEHCMADRAAFAKIQRGLEDDPYLEMVENQSRWEYCLGVILRIHGQSNVDQVVASTLTGKSSQN